MYKSINKILLSLVLFCVGDSLCMAQLVGPDGKPTNPVTAVAKVESKEFSSISDAFQAVNVGTADPVTINLLLGVTLKEATSLVVSKNITFRLNGKQLTGSSRITATVTDSKTLVLKEGILSGNLVWEGNGKLFAGADMDLSVLTVTRDAVKLYRVLVKLPAGYGTVKDAYYGSGGVTTFAQSGDIICCWLPLYTAAQNITLSDDGGKRYIVSGVVATAHAATPIEATLNVAPDMDIAEVTKTGETTPTKYRTLKEAFSALEATTGKIKLRSDASFSESLPIRKAVELDLNGKILSASYGAAFVAENSGNLHVKNGVLSGTLEIKGDVIIDQSVTIAGTNVIDGIGKNAVYRVRLTLPSSEQGRSLSFTYGAKVAVTIPRILTENSVTTAYVWLPAESTARSFTLKATGSPDEVIVKSNVTINANHDNYIDLTVGDMVARLIVMGSTSSERLFPSFHDALVAAASVSGNCKIELLTNVSLNGTVGHAHTLGGNRLVTIDLNGYNLTGENCWLQATELNSAYIITDSRKTGSLTGQLQIDGNVYITEDITASKIGEVVRQSATGTPLYRLMASISTPDALTDGFVTYKLDGSGTSASCYMKNKKISLFLPSGNNEHTLTVEIGVKTYSVSNIVIQASHSNVATLRLPTEVAKIDGVATYSTLAAALTAAGLQQQGDVTIELLNQASLSAKHSISKKITIDLKDFALTMEGTNSEWNVTSGGSLYIKSSTKAATIRGDFAVSEAVCISADVGISGSVKKGTTDVYRTRFYLPAGTKAAEYTFNSQTGSLIFPGETRMDGRAVGYAFLQVESGYNDLTVKITNPAGSAKDTYQLKQVFLQAFHNNQFNMEAGEHVVKISNTEYTLFSAALAVANQSGGTIELLRDLSLSGIHTIANDVTIDLNGYTLNTTDDAYFSIAGDKSLVIKDSNTSTPGSLYGIFRMQGGALFVSPDVKIAGTVVCEGEELYRCLGTGIGASYTGTTRYDSHTIAIQNSTACFWLLPVTVEQDLTFRADGKDYEITLQPSLPNHNNRVQGYPVVKVTGNTIWSDNTYEGYNIYLTAGSKLEIAAGAGIKNFHRVVMEKGAEIVCNMSILATAGITYRHEFEKEKTWEAFSLPYHARLVRKMSDDGLKEVRPYQMDGTGGDFWLKTIAPEGRFDYVTEERIVANTGYIIAVPRELTSLDNSSVRIDFVSPTEQFLNRKVAALPEPKAGEFMQTASGILCKMKLERPFYKLSDDGTEYTRVDATAAQPFEILPFTSFLLSDSKTQATYSTLRMGSLPTAVETSLLPNLTMRVTGLTGGVRVESEGEAILEVYTLMGRPVCFKKISVGITFLPLQPGLYIVNREKVVVR